MYKHKNPPNTLNFCHGGYNFLNAKEYSSLPIFPKRHSYKVVYTWHKMNKTFPLTCRFAYVGVTLVLQCHASP